MDRWGSRRHEKEEKGFIKGKEVRMYME